MAVGSHAFVYCNYNFAFVNIVLNGSRPYNIDPDRCPTNILPLLFLQLIRHHSERGAPITYGHPLGHGLTPFQRL